MKTSDLIMNMNYNKKKNYSLKWEWIIYKLFFFNPLNSHTLITLWECVPITFVHAMHWASFQPNSPYLAWTLFKCNLKLFILDFPIIFFCYISFMFKLVIMLLDRGLRDAFGCKILITNIVLSNYHKCE